MNKIKTFWRVADKWLTCIAFLIGWLMFITIMVRYYSK